jgi:hypothetical protein
MPNNALVACHDFAAELWLLVSGEMPKDRQQLWQRHLQNCAHCQEALATAQAVQAQYVHLPLYEVPERLVQSLAHRAKLQQEEVGWLMRISHWFSTVSWRFDFRPRLAIVGAVLAAFLLVLFHRLAFRTESLDAWEATAFDQKVSELWNTLGQYNADLSHDKWSFDDLTESAAVSTFDEQASDLRESLSTMSSELSRTKM